MVELGSAIFKAGQKNSFDKGDKFEGLHFKAYISKGKCANGEKHLRSDFKSNFLDKALANGVGISSDGLTQKLQGKNYYDMVIHYIDSKSSRNLKIFSRFLFWKNKEHRNQLPI